MSIYIPSEKQEVRGASKNLADTLINMVEGICEKHPDKFQIARSPDECIQIVAKGKIALPMGMENGAGIEDDLKNVAYFRERGISYITLTHGKVNLICDSSYDPRRLWNGLSPFGRQVVQEMNRLGVMVDISHVSDDTFYEVMALTKVPAIASHSSSRYFTPDFERNMSDDMLKALGDNGGVIMINFGSSFLNEDIRLLRNKLKNFLEANGLDRRDPEALPLIQEFQKKHPNLFSDVERVADHIDHIVKMAGIDHVGLGSDFDGVGDSLPVGLKDVSDYPNLIYELLQRGYSTEDIGKICSGNLFRVWNEVIEYSERMKA
jgi:membrane dipeptidase